MYPYNCSATPAEAFEITGQVSAALWSAVCVRVAWGIPNYCPPLPPPPCFPPPLTCSSSPPPPPYFIFPRKLFTSLMASRRIRLSMNESQPASTLAKHHTVSQLASPDTTIATTSHASSTTKGASEILIFPELGALGILSRASGTKFSHKLIINNLKANCALMVMI